MELDACFAPEGMQYAPHNLTAIETAIQQLTYINLDRNYSPAQSTEANDFEYTSLQPVFDMVQ